jgi:hypothetical protein
VGTTAFYPVIIYPVEQLRFALMPIAVIAGLKYL